VYKIPIGNVFRWEGDVNLVKTPEELGAFLRKARKKAMLTQDEVSGLMNAGNRLLGEIERGKKTAQIGRVMEAIHLLGYDIFLVKRGEDG
jgi:transcriptional regulator with XRE-family HTH domain